MLNNKETGAGNGMRAGEGLESLRMVGGVKKPEKLMFTEITDIKIK